MAAFDRNAVLEQRVDEGRSSCRRQDQQSRHEQHHDDERQEPEFLVLLQEAEELGDNARLLAAGGVLEVVGGLGHGMRRGLVLTEVLRRWGRRFRILPVGGSCFFLPVQL